MSDGAFHITLQNFNEGIAPLSTIDDKTFIGGAGQATSVKADLISKPGFITQSPGLSALTNGTQAGSVSELIRFILDLPTDTDVTWGVSASKFFKISSTTVINTGGYPKTITNIINNIMYFFISKLYHD
jgi:hypothetical protein